MEKAPLFLIAEKYTKIMNCDYKTITEEAEGWILEYQQQCTSWEYASIKFFKAKARGVLELWSTLTSGERMRGVDFSRMQGHIDYFDEMYRKSSAE